jgi:hypothetical protein
VATVEECRVALENLLGRITELDPATRQAHLVDRDISCQVPDLGVTFQAKIGPDGAGPVTEADSSGPQAQIRMTANSDALLALSADPATFGRAWLTGRIKIQASFGDILRLRKLL